MLDELRGVKELATKTIFFYQLRALVSFNFNNEVTEYYRMEPRIATLDRAQDKLHCG